MVFTFTPDVTIALFIYNNNGDLLDTGFQPKKKVFSEPYAYRLHTSPTLIIYMGGV